MCNAAVMCHMQVMCHVQRSCYVPYASHVPCATQDSREIVYVRDSLALHMAHDCLETVMCHVQRETVSVCETVMCEIVWHMCNAKQARDSHVHMHMTLLHIYI